MKILLKYRGAKERALKAIGKTEYERYLLPFVGNSSFLEQLYKTGNGHKFSDVVYNLRFTSQPCGYITRGQLRRFYTMHQSSISYSKLANLLGVDKKKIQRWLRGKKDDSCFLPITIQHYWQAQRSFFHQWRYIAEEKRD